MKRHAESAIAHFLLLLATWAVSAVGGTAVVLECSECGHSARKPTARGEHDKVTWFWVGGGMIETKKRILLYCSTCKNFEAKSVIDESRTKEAIDRLKKAIDRLPEGDKRREQWRMFALPHLTKELKNVNPDAELCLKCTRKREEVVIDWSALAIAKRDMLSKKPRPQWRGQKLDMPCPACAKKALRALPTGLEWD